VHPDGTILTRRFDGTNKDGKVVVGLNRTGKAYPRSKEDADAQPGDVVEVEPPPGVTQDEWDKAVNKAGIDLGNKLGWLRAGASGSDPETYGHLPWQSDCWTVSHRIIQEAQTAVGVGEEWTWDESAGWRNPGEEAAKTLGH